MLWLRQFSESSIRWYAQLVTREEIITFPQIYSWAGWGQEPKFLFFEVLWYWIVYGRLSCCKLISAGGGNSSWEKGTLTGYLDSTSGSRCLLGKVYSRKECKDWYNFQIRVPCHCRSLWRQLLAYKYELNNHNFGTRARCMVGACTRIWTNKNIRLRCVGFLCWYLVAATEIENRKKKHEPTAVDGSERVPFSLQGK